MIRPALDYRVEHLEEHLHGRVTQVAAPEWYCDDRVQLRLHEQLGGRSD